MRAETASRAPHARKHGATFAESWTSADGATIVAVGAVLAGGDPIVVSDLLRTGARAVVTSRKALVTALGSLDRIVQKHAREHRDDDLAAAVMLLAFVRGAHELDVAGAGQLHAALIDGSGAQQPLHGHAGALGTGIDAASAVQRIRLRRDDLAVVATIPVERAWWDSGDRSASGLLQRSGEHDASVAVVAFA
jgi:Stage II sporulation protein E (SpoIIE)